MAGFNQFYDDIAGTESRRFGVALDHKFSSGLFGGLEVSKRILVVPQQVEMQNWSEELIKAYLNWTPNKRLAFKQNIRMNILILKKQKNPTGTPNTKTHLVPFTMSYFDPSGFFATLGVTYINQHLNNNESNPERNQYVSVDSSIGYRFPKRYGIIRIKTNNLLNENIIYHLNQRTNVEEQTLSFL